MNKRLFLLAVSCTISSVALCQTNDATDDDWENTPNHIVTEPDFHGNVGINVQSPSAKLHIKHEEPYEPVLKVVRDNSTLNTINPPPVTPVVEVSIRETGGQAVDAFSIDNDGDVGLGTFTPSAKLHVLMPTASNFTGSSKNLFEVESENFNYTALGVNESGIIHVGSPFSHSSVTNSTRAQFEVWGLNNTALDLNANFLASFRNWAGSGRVLRLKGGWAHPTNNIPIFQVESNGDGADTYDDNIRFQVLASGRVVIGENLNLVNGYRLYVEEGIITEKLRVAVKNTSEWADYVFDDDYKLLDLEEVENYIDAHCHLPGVPSAEEVAEQGVDVAQMDALLLQKIEELTLYLIELEKQNQELASRLSESGL